MRDTLVYTHNADRDTVYTMLCHIVFAILQHCDDALSLSLEHINNHISYKFAVPLVGPGAFEIRFNVGPSLEK